MTNLEQLEQATQDLNRQCDEAAAYVQKLEEKLRTCGVGLIILGIDRHLRIEFTTWGKNVNWRILVQDHAHAKPWAECSRHMKLLTFGHMDKLVQVAYGRIAEQQKLASAALFNVTLLKEAK